MSENSTPTPAAVKSARGKPRRAFAPAARSRCLAEAKYNRRSDAMNLDRIRSAAAAIALSLAWAGGALAQTAPAPQALAQDVWLIAGGFPDKRQPDGNTVVFEGATGLVVLDTGRHRWQRQAILDFARARKVRIAAIVNSHWHLDHVSGNPDLKAAYPDAKVYASDAIDGALAGFLKDSAVLSREYLKSPGVPEGTAADIRGDVATIDNGAALRPDVVVRQSGILVLAGRKMQVHLAADGPTAGDVWLYAPASRIAAVGDLVTLPVPFFDTACVAGWQSALAEIESTSFETLVPGHGKPMTRAEFGHYRIAFDNFVACANSSRDQAECAAGWAKDAGALLEANGMDPNRAQGMAVYYVNQVLRPNGGNSKFCRTRG